MPSLAKTLVASLLIGLAGTAHAAGLYIGGSTSDISFSGYNNPPAAVTGPYSKGTLGTLYAGSAGTVTATYLGDESGYDNFFRFFSPQGNQTLYEDSHNPSTPVGSSIAIDVNAGDVVPFLYKDNKGVTVTNGTPFVSTDYATFAMLYTLSDTAAKVYSNATSYGFFDFIVGFNDSYKGDADYDDYVVGLRFAASPVPLPAAGWLFGTALLGLLGWSRRKSVA